MSDRFRAVPRSTDRVIAGVAGGWADRWNVEPTVLRAAVGLLTLVGGIGVVLYGAAALASTPPLPVGETKVRSSAPRNHRRELAVGCGTAAILVAARSVGLWPGDGIMLAASAVAGGTAATWTVDGWRPVRARARATWMRRGLQLAAGLTLLAAGVISLARRTGGLANVGASTSAIAVVVGGLTIFAAPALGRMLRTLDEERALRIREDERAAVAAHLHDSVLQSLVLIQRSDDPRRMSSLARRQERELRAWLYGTAPPGEPTSLHAAIDLLTVEIETDHDVRVEAVIVGDQPLDSAARTLVAALREALVNAARHAKVDRVDVFVEADSAELTGFVRDTGRGFELDQVPEDRRGISDSIVGRLQRAGGSATLTSEIGVGTEIELRVPRRRR
jgi:signal transduction histidine kinase/phage shock protein PspC (stress-responsive transcriptional regulator)